MKPRAILACVSILLALLTRTAAADTPPSKPWSLEDCLKTAMANQIDVIVARNNVAAANSRVDRARAAYFPRLSIQNNAFVTGSEAVLSKATTGTALNVTQSIFDGGIREANAASARYGATQNTARLTRTVQTVTFNVTRAYYDVLRAKHLAEVAETNVKYTQELKAQVEAFAESGQTAKVDVLPVEAQLANARVSLLTAQNAVRTSALSLQSAIGLAPTPGFDVQEVAVPADAGQAVEPKLLALSEYLSQAAAARPDVTEAQAAYGSARASVRSARINLYPIPVISAEYERGLSGGFTTSGGQVVGGVSFDLFNGGANRAAYREARAAQASAEQQRQQVLKDIQVEVEEAYLNLTSSKERLAASEVSLKAAEANYKAQTARYNEGVGITLDLLNAEVQLITAQTNEVQARYDYYTALAQLDYATGKQGGAK